MLSISVEQGLRVEVNFYSGENKVTGCYSSPQVDATHLRSQITVALYHSSFSQGDSSSASSPSRFNLTEQHLYLKMSQFDCSFIVMWTENWRCPHLARWFHRQQKRPFVPLSECCIRPASDSARRCARYQRVSDGLRRSQRVLEGLGWSHIASDCLGWSQKVLDSLKWSQMVFDGLRWFRMMCLVSDGFQPWQSFPVTSFVTRWNSSKNLRQKRPIYIGLAGIPQQNLVK